MRIIMPMLAALGLLAISCQNNTGQVQTTPDGYEYVMHTNAEGATPQPGEYAYFHAQIRKGDSVVYQTRVYNPQMPFLPIPTEDTPAPQVSPISGALALMAVGDSATLYVPIDSMGQTPPDFVGEENMIYDLVLVDIKTEEAFMTSQQEDQTAAAAAAEEAKLMVDDIVEQYQAGAFDDQIQETGTGLRYILLQEGTGPEAEVGDIVWVDYYGVLAEGGEMFDNSYRRGASFPFPLGQGQVIRGWDLGIDQLSEGAEALLLVPSELGYGEAGSGNAIPANADLIFHVDLVKVNKLQ